MIFLKLTGLRESSSIELAQPLPEGADRRCIQGETEIGERVDYLHVGELLVDRLLPRAALPSPNAAPAPGETVLVTGAAGSVGMIAGQAVLARGASAAGLVVDEQQKRTVESVGIASFLVEEAEEDVRSAIGRLAPAGIDVVVDSLWGHYPDRFVPALNDHARWVQVGSSAGGTASINAPVFRNKRISFIGHTNSLLTEQEATEPYNGIAELAAQGEISLEFESGGLDEVPVVWPGLVDKTRSGKFVVTF